MSTAKDLTRQSWPDFRRRLESIGADTPRQWGKMSAAEMCRHMTLSVQGGLGEVNVEDRGNFAIRMLVPIFFSGLIPFPKGRAQTAPEYVARDVGEFESERAALLAAIERFLVWCEKHPDARARHPFFGDMDVKRWQRGHALHLDHHLKQFGA